MTAGTGGTITGVAKVDQARGAGLQDHRRRSRGLDPRRAPARSRRYKVEGIGYDFIPDVLDRRSSIAGSSPTIATRSCRAPADPPGGPAVGGSSGSAGVGGDAGGRDLGPGKRVVVILPDSIRNYLSKFVDDRWMRQQGFLKADWEVGTVGDVMRASAAAR
jgi:Cysteine synthase